MAGLCSPVLTPRAEPCPARAALGLLGTRTLLEARWHGSCRQQVLGAELWHRFPSFAKQRDGANALAPAGHRGFGALPPRCLLPGVRSHTRSCPRAPSTCEPHGEGAPRPGAGSLCAPAPGAPRRSSPERTQKPAPLRAVRSLPAAAARARPRHDALHNGPAHPRTPPVHPPHLTGLRRPPNASGGSPCPPGTEPARRRRRLCAEPRAPFSSSSSSLRPAEAWPGGAAAWGSCPGASGGGAVPGIPRCAPVPDRNGARWRRRSGSCAPAEQPPRLGSIRHSQGRAAH